jgi:HSP20 family protein
MANRTLSPLFQDFVTLRDAMDRLFEQSFVDPTRLLSFDGSPRSMPLEVYETPEAVVVKALVPGVTPEQLDVTYDRGILTLHAKTETPAAHDDWTWHLREIGYGEYSRAVNLPTAVKIDDVQTDFQNGILTLQLPKAEEARPKQIRITPAKQLTSNAQ